MKPKCQRCGTTKDVEYTIDPYQQDIHDVEEWVYLCPVCYQEYCDDI